MKRGKRLSPLGSLLATLGFATILGSPALSQSITLRGTSNNFNVVVIDETPNSFSFSSVSNVEPGDVVVASPMVTVAGLGSSVPVSVSGQGSPKFRINGGGLVTSGTVSNGDTVEMSLETSLGALNTNYTARLTIGTFGANFNVSTRSGDITPDAFAFANVTNAEPGTITATPTVTVAGLESSVMASVSGTGAPRLKINGGALVTSGSVSNGSTVQLVLTAASAFQSTYNATVTIGNGTGTFQAVTRVGDVTPDAFSFTSVSAAEPGTTITSNAVNLTGFEGSLAVSITGSGSPKLKINGGSAVSSGTVTAGDTLAIQVDAAANAFSTTYTANVLVGAVPASFEVSTRTADVTPDAFSFTSATAVEPGATVTSNTITLAGFDGSLPVTVSGTGSPKFKINGGAAVTTGNVSAGDTIAVELIPTAGVYSATYTGTVSVGSVSRAFDATTRAADTTANAFSFTAEPAAAVSTTVSSNTVTLSGFDLTLPISISKTGTGTSCYKVNGGSCLTSASTVSSGDTVQIQTTVGSVGGETTVATLDVGGVTADYSVTTFSSCQTKDLTTLALGASSCSVINGSERQTIYAGLVGGVRVYVTPMAGTYQWKTTATATTGTGTATANGITNTNAMATAGIALHPGGQACRALSADWYMPARDEVVAVQANRNVGDLTTLVAGAGDRFWTSTQATTNTNGIYVTWSTGAYTGITKTTAYPMFCMRR